MNEPRKVAVVGTGSIGTRHLRTLKDLNCQPIAIPKRKTRLVELEKEGYLVAEDLETAAQKGATLCVVASDTALHVEDGLKALEYNMNLLVEKPVGVDASSCVPLLQRATEKKRDVFVGCVLRFNPSLHCFREKLESIGPVYRVQIDCGGYLPDWREKRSFKDSYSARFNEGGVLRDLIHEIDYATWIFGWPKTVEANLMNLGRLGIESEELADLRWKTGDGTYISVNLDYISPQYRRSMTAFGDLGILFWDGVKSQVTLEKQGKSKEEFSFASLVQPWFVKQMESFLAGGTKHSTSLRDGIQALSICDAARLASQNRQEETIHYLV